DTERPDGIDDGLRAPHRSGGTVEARQDAVAGRIHSPSPVTLKLAADDGIVLVEELRPLLVAEASGVFGGGDDVGEEDGGEGAVGVTDWWDAGDELLDLVD